MTICNDVCAFFEEHLVGLPLFKAMEETVENSPWHREENVLVHTRMVLNEYEKLLEGTEWCHTRNVLGALATIFHDVGKPPGKQVKMRADGTSYNSFGGHEILSTRLWEDYAVANWSLLLNWFPDLYVEDIYKVGWMIQHHLPYSLKDKTKRFALKATVDSMAPHGEVFQLVLKADTRGRISDDHPTKIQAVNDWCDAFYSIDAVSQRRVLEPDPPVCVMLIGPSGTGKTTYINDQKYHNDFTYYSWDELRLKYYITSDEQALPIEERYGLAWVRHKDDKDFTKRAQAEFIGIVRARKNVVVDNTNLSNKRRRFFVTEAQNRGYKMIAVLTPISLEQLYANNEKRTDKYVCRDIQHSMYMRLEYPNYLDFDKIIVRDCYVNK